MKKLFTFLSAALLASAGYAQTAFQEDFSSTTGTALPVGWTQTKITSSNGWFTNSGAYSFYPGVFELPAGNGRYVVIDDYNHDDSNNLTGLITPVINLTGYSHVWATFNAYFANAIYNDRSKQEHAYVSVTTDGGNNWTKLMDLTPGVVWTLNAVDLSAYSNVSNLQLGFFYSDDNLGKLIGCAIDDIKIFTPVATDISVSGVKLPKINTTTNMAGAGTNPKVTVFNNGYNTVTSIDAQYTIDGGTPVTKTFSGLSIAPFTGQELSFDALSAVGLTTHNMDVTTNNVNGAPDAVSTNNQGSVAFTGASQTVAREGLIEEFSSSTCVPCANFNITFDPLIQSNKANSGSSNFNVVKYQMNWPVPGTDPSYNSHGVSRKNYYGVTGIPDHFTNGLQGGAGDQDEINSCKDEPSFLSIDGDYTVTGDSVFIAASVTPHYAMSLNLKVYMALVEYDYNYYQGTTTQKYYVYVMRKMYPGGTGSSLLNGSDGNTVNFSFSDKFSVGDVKQNNFNFWTHPMNSNLVIFVQDDASKKILQSAAVPAHFPTAIKTVAGDVTNFTLYPNPATDAAFMAFNLNEPAKIKVQVLDAVGRVVTTIGEQQYTPGQQQITINTASLSAGIYTVKLQTEKGTLTHQLSVVK